MLLLGLLVAVSPGPRPALPAQGEPAPAPGFVELACERPVLYAGERFAVRVRFGFAEGPPEEARVPLFRQELDLSVELVLPFEDGTPQIEALPAAEEAAGASLVVDGRVARARPLGDMDRGGRRFEAFELERWYRAASPGRCELSGARLRWATARRWGEDLLGEPVALESEEHAALAAPLALEVRPLPEEGRPVGFTGAVGELTLTARAEPRDLHAGESLQLVVEVRGSGSLEGFELPRAGWPGLPCLGSLEGLSEGARTIRYDLRPESPAVREIPSLALPYFRPAPEPGYAVATTAPIPILVRPPRETAEGAATGAAGPAEPAGGPPAASEPAAVRRWPVLAAAGACGAIALLLAQRARAASRRRGGRGSLPGGGA